MSPDYEFSSELVLWGARRQPHTDGMCSYIAHRYCQAKWTANIYVIHTCMCAEYPFKQISKTFQHNIFALFSFFELDALWSILYPPPVLNPPHIMKLTISFWLRIYDFNTSKSFSIFSQKHYVWQTFKLYARVFREVATECLCFAKRVYGMDLSTFYMFGCVSDNKF